MIFETEKNKEKMEIGIEKVTEDKEMINLGVVSNSVSENCRCNELEDRSKKAELRCAELEFELQKKNNQCEALEAKLKELEVEKFSVEQELKALRSPNEELIKQLRIQIGESPSKKMAPSPDGAKSASVRVINSNDEPNITLPPVPDSQGSINVSVFVTENGNLSNSNAPNNEEDLDISEDAPFFATPRTKRTFNVVTSESEHYDDGGGGGYDDDNIPISKLKRSHIDDDDDNIPISKLKRSHIQEVCPDQIRCETNSFVTAATSVDEKVTNTATPRWRLVPLRSNQAKQQQSIPTDADESEDLSDCKDEEGLSDFIVDDSDVSNCDDVSSKSQDISNADEGSDSGNVQDVPDKDIRSDSQDVSDGNVDFVEILWQIQRKKDRKTKWEFEADMLADFGKDPELCMKAVCALYRQQTPGEQVSRVTFVNNNRGFSMFDAERGSYLAEFLTEGDPRGGLKKSSPRNWKNMTQKLSKCAEHWPVNTQSNYMKSTRSKRILFFPKTVLGN